MTNSSSREDGRGSCTKVVASESRFQFAQPVKWNFSRMNLGGEARGLWRDGLTGARFLFAGPKVVWISAIGDESNRNLVKSRDVERF